MAVFFKLLERFAAHAMGRRIGHLHAGFLFQAQQLIIQPVVLHVGHDGLVLRIIGVGRAVEQCDQLAHTPLLIFHGDNHSSIFTMGAMDCASTFSPNTGNTICSRAASPLPVTSRITPLPNLGC